MSQLLFRQVNRSRAARAPHPAEVPDEALESPQAPSTAAGDFHRAADLGVTGFPALLAVAGTRVVPLARGHATADDIDRRMAALS